MYQPWLFGMVVVALAILGGLALHSMVYALISRFRRNKPQHANAHSWIHSTRRPVLSLLLLGILAAALGALPIDKPLIEIIDHGILIVFIACIAWLLINLLEVIRSIVVIRYRTDVNDNLQARRIHTQMAVVNRAAASLIIVLALALMMMTFPQVWSLGAGLFASAGVAGIILGTAAKGVLGNLLAGLQIALTQPIRIDDVVIVQGEWGRIEEIGSAYVIVRIWDLRRLVVPLNYFIEQPFQNWTRISSDLMGTVFLYVDYSVPVEEVRRELRRILEAEARWDKNVCVLQVTDAKDQTIELRALMSAGDAGTLFDLRCIVREQLIAFLAQKYPDSLPRMRQENFMRSAGKEADAAGPPLPERFPPA